MQADISPGERRRVTVPTRKRTFVSSSRSFTVHTPSPWRPGQLDTSPASCATGLWLGFLGASCHAVLVAVVAVFAQSVARSSGYTAPPPAGTPQRTRPAAAGVCTVPAQPPWRSASCLSGTGEHFSCVCPRQRKCWLVTFHSDDTPGLDNSHPATQRGIRRTLVLGI